MGRSEILIKAVMIFSVLSVCAYPEEDSCSQTGCSPEKSSKQFVPEQQIKDLTYEDFVQLKKSDKKFLIVDVRPKESYLTGHIKGAISFPLQEMFLDTITVKLPKSIKIVVYCGSASCPASAQAAQKLKNLGYDVEHYKGGVNEWTKHGNVLVK